MVASPLWQEPVISISLGWIALTALLAVVLLVGLAVLLTWRYWQRRASAAPHAPPWLFGLYRNGDILLIVLDAQADVQNDFEAILNSLKAHNIFVNESEFGDVKNAIVVINKSDDTDKTDMIDSFTTQNKDEFDIIQVSATTGVGAEQLRKQIFASLHIIRVYTKKIGHPINKKEPVVLKRGTTVIDAAEHIHKDFKKKLKFARLWSDSDYNGQRVEKNHVLTDGDVLEFHV